MLCGCVRIRMSSRFTTIFSPTPVIIPTEARFAPVRMTEWGFNVRQPPK
jgi:hypothetical protein